MPSFFPRLNNWSTDQTVKAIEATRLGAVSPSHRARARMQGARGELLFIADWDNVLMIHFAIEPESLQPDVPFDLDLWEGRAFVTLVAFTMRGMRPAFGCCLTSWLFRPIATHHFLNVRTYVRVGGDVGIHFLAEWISSRLARALVPRTFSLPYRMGRIRYDNDWRSGPISGRVKDAAREDMFAYQAELDIAPGFSECEQGSLDEWLMERYGAFNSACDRKRYFRVWHGPWLQCRADVEMADTSLLAANYKWFTKAQFSGANYSPGAPDVWLGRPHRIKSRCRS